MDYIIATFGHEATPLWFPREREAASPGLLINRRSPFAAALRKKGAIASEMYKEQGGGTPSQEFAAACPAWPESCC